MFKELSSAMNGMRINLVVRAPGGDVYHYFFPDAERYYEFLATLPMTYRFAMHIIPNGQTELERVNFSSS